MPPPQSTYPESLDQISIESSEPDRLSDSDDAQSDILVGPDTTGHKIKYDNNPRLLPQRTYETLRLERPIPGEKAGKLVTTHRFYGSSSPASVEHGMLDRLAPGKWLTVALVNFYLFEVANSYVEQTPGAGRVVCALPESIWSSSDNSHGKYTPRPRRDKAESVLDFDYVVFPGNCTNSHFYLCIIAYASDILADRNPSGDVRTVGLVLNSLVRIGPTDALNRFRNVILRLGKQRPIREDGLKKLKVYYPRVPQQENSYDCGLYPAYFLSVFLSDPEKYLKHCLGKEQIPGEIDAVWFHEGIKSARQNLRELVKAAVDIRAASMKFNTDFPSSSSGRSFY